MTKEENKKLQIQIPTKLIKNECGYNLDYKSFVVFVALKYLEFRSYVKEGDEFDIRHRELITAVGFADSRPLKECFKVLHKQGLIVNDVSKLPRNNALMAIQLYTPHDYENGVKVNYTQLPPLFYKLKDIGFIGLRLLYYYESYINRKKYGKDHAYPAQITIADDLSCSYSTLDKYNKILEREKLIKVNTHDFKFDGYNELDKAIFHRFNNHYFVNIDNL